MLPFVNNQAFSKINPIRRSFALDVMRRKIAACMQLDSPMQFGFSDHLAQGAKAQR